MLPPTLRRLHYALKGAGKAYVSGTDPCSIDLYCGTALRLKQGAVGAGPIQHAAPFRRNGRSAARKVEAGVYGLDAAFVRLSVVAQV